jgi:hypothetical protein
VIEATDPKFRPDEIKKFLQGSNPVSVWEVPN